MKEATEQLRVEADRLLDLALALNDGTNPWAVARTLRAITNRLAILADAITVGPPPTGQVNAPGRSAIHIAGDQTGTINMGS